MPAWKEHDYGSSVCHVVSDSDSEFNDGDEMGDYDLFGRLEESRAQLEEALGADKLIKVYKTVQVRHLVDYSREPTSLAKSL